jgi:hypothetical protein
MPGLKALTDRLPTGDTSRSVTLYTASFSVGVGLSFLVAQLVEERFGWRAAFYVTGTGPNGFVSDCLTSSLGAAARTCGIIRLSSLGPKTHHVCPGFLPLLHVLRVKL